MQAKVFFDGLRAKEEIEIELHRLSHGSLDYYSISGDYYDNSLEIFIEEENKDQEWVADEEFVYFVLAMGFWNVFITWPDGSEQHCSKNNIGKRVKK